MSFSVNQQSDNDGKPVALYLFSWGNSQWGYTSAERQIVHNSITYEPIAVDEDELVQGGKNEGEFTFRVPANLPVVQLFRGTPPSTPVVLTVRRIEYDDILGESVIHWISPITNVRRKSEAISEIVSRNRGLRRGGLRLTWSRSCPHFLYGSGCKVLKALFAAPRTIAGINGNVITVNLDTPSTGWFNGGFIEWDADGLGTMERRGIEIETGTNSFQLFGRSDGLSIGMDITLYPGCDRTVEECDSKFDNLANNGGVKFMPGKSPFEGTAII